MDQTDPITRILLKGTQTQVFPGAVLFVRHEGQIRVHQAIGLTSSHPDSPFVQLNTIYDLASLTKPLATASSILILVQEGRLSLTRTLATLQAGGIPLVAQLAREFTAQANADQKADNDSHGPVSCLVLVSLEIRGDLLRIRTIIPNN